MKISVIILSFNNYDETTGRCLSVLSVDPDFHLWDVIVVDNSSDEITLQKLYASKVRYPNVNFIFNNKNVGYAAGNNIGIKRSVGDVLVLLNSDAFPPSGMLTKLASRLANNTDIGMLGPVTNAAGNEQSIYTAGTNEIEKTFAGLQFAESGGSDVFSAYRLDFHCVAVSRSVIDRVGLLDESFGRGYYEDLDYSIRVKELGYKLGFVEDVFVYHRGSASFGKVPLETKKLIRKNKLIIKKKHGSKIEIPHKREANLAVLMQYIRLIKMKEMVPIFRVKNRLQQAKGELPRGWYKRWRYLKKLKCIENDLINSGIINVI